MTAYAQRRGPGMKQVPGVADTPISAIYFPDVCHPGQRLGDASVLILLIPAAFKVALIAWMSCRMSDFVS